MTKINVDQLNKDIALFPQVFPITPDMDKSFSGVSRLIMLDRYTFKDTEKKTFKVGDFVVLTVKTDPKFPARGYGFITGIDHAEKKVNVKLDEAFVGVLEDATEIETGTVTRSIDVVEKPLEVYYEQIAKRNAFGLASVETSEKARVTAFNDFYDVLVSLDFVPGGRVIYGAGTGTDVTFFNCYVMPYPQDSREGIGEHRNKVMEIMSRGGGVGTNGSTLRPKNALARGVNGKSSGAVSWLDDIAKLTHLVEQGGSRRGAQMIMLADWHPDIIEFIVSKLQNPRILRFLIDTTTDEEVRRLAKDKLKFTPLSDIERESLQLSLSKSTPGDVVNKYAGDLLADGGRYSVNNSEFLTGANISVAITKEFMEAVEADADYELRFPDIDNYGTEDKTEYNAKWHKSGDVREWAELGYAIKTHRTVKAKELWNLINICATYSAEPGIFFIDNANEATNAVAYGQKVVATNPCFTGDMRLLTADGYKTFEELEKSGGDVDVINKDGIVSRGKVWSSGIKEVVEVRLSNKTKITCTPDHVFMTNTGDEVEASDLKGERVMPYLKEQEDLEIDYELFGFIQGDGQLTRLSSESHLGLEVNVGANDLEIRHIFRKTFPVTEYADDRSIYVTGLNEKLRELGFSAKVLPEREFPTSYNTWSQVQKQSFLRGCYSANGSIIHVGRIAYKTTCRNFAEQLLITLENDFGIKGYITTNKAKDVTFSNGTYTCKESYDINISTFEGMQSFYNTIGFIHRYKMFTLREILLEKAPKVVGVKALAGTQKVYDFSEPLTHWGVVENVIVHNCGEQPLAPYSVCNLAAVNLANMVDKKTKSVDYDRLIRTVEVGVRLMDNVITATPYFMQENTVQALGERRLGMGVMGLHDLLIYCEAEYGSKHGNEIVDKVFEVMATTAYRKSIELAQEKGPFPFLEEREDGYELFVNSGYMKKMPDDIREGVLKHGIRNSHILTVAPTGSTGSMVGCSTGLEPYFSFKYYRSGRLGKFMEVVADIVQEYLDANPSADSTNLPAWFVSSMQLTPEQHVDVQCIIQRWIDSSLSKTVNAPKGYTVEQVQAVYERLYKGGAKGGTVYVDGSRDAQVLSLTAEENTFEESAQERKVVLIETINEVRSTDVNVGNEVGDTCPICRKGEIIDAGGCTTCNNCGVQLKCGL